MKNLFILIFLTAISPLGFCIGWTGQVYHLVDDKTGNPLVILKDGNPEAFFAGGGELLFVGYFTKTRIEQDPPPKGFQYPDVDVGSRFKLRGKDQWVRVEKWCCDNYSRTYSQNLPGWREYFTKVSDKLQDFGFEEEIPELECVPLIYSVVFLFDPKTLRPRWSKFYAAVRDVEDRACPNQHWYPYSYAYIGSSLDERSVVVKVDDANNS
ncbi:hypothetical protein ACO0K7_19465 [Undibacterium sp. Ji67W]|uniref:hypothetical protein n=1 Tax=Undibacterium sp. Ji67W TaxID=3413042 RepID=UPI003BF41882